jgi:hypothetical protein
MYFVEHVRESAERPSVDVTSVMIAAVAKRGARFCGWTPESARTSAILAAQAEVGRWHFDERMPDYQNHLPLS